MIKQICCWLLLAGFLSAANASGPIVINGPQQQNAVFLPSSLSNLVGWYRKGVGQAAGQWDDQSGSGNHMTMFATPTISGGGYVLNGTTQYGRAVFTLNQPSTMCIRFGPVTWTSTRFILDGANSGSSSIYMPATASPEVNGFAGSFLVDATNMVPGSLNSICFVANSTSSIFKVNGGANVTGDAGTGNAGGVTVGTDGAADVSSFVALTVYEIIVYANAKSAGELTSLFTYMGAL